MIRIHFVHWISKAFEKTSSHQRIVRLFYEYLMYKCLQIYLSWAVFRIFTSSVFLCGTATIIIMVNDETHDQNIMWIAIFLNIILTHQIPNRNANVFLKLLKHSLLLIFVAAFFHYRYIWCSHTLDKFY